MSKNNSHTDPRDLEAALELSRNLTRVIETCMTYGGVSQSGFAQEIGLSRSSLNQIFRARSSSHLWRLPQLCAVARALHVSVTDLFSEAERSEDEGEMPCQNRLARKALLYETKPGSPERLRRMIVQEYRDRAVLGGLPDIAERENFEEICKCTMVEIEFGAPAFYKAYMDGELDEHKLREAISAAFDYVFGNGGPGKIPFWVALQETYHSV